MPNNPAPLEVLADNLALIGDELFAPILARTFLTDDEVAVRYNLLVTYRRVIEACRSEFDDMLKNYTGELPEGIEHIRKPKEPTTPKVVDAKSKFEALLKK